MERMDVSIQELSFLELTEPSIEEGFQRCVKQGAAEITVVPLFLLAAGHIKQDIPQALAILKVKYPDIKINVKDPFGVQSKILDAVAELVLETVEGPVGRQDRALVVGRGSSDPGIQADFTLIADGIKERLGLEEVSVCYLAAAEPRLHEGFETIMEQPGSRVIVIPYLLFSGLLTTEVNQEIRKWQKQGRTVFNTGTLSSHRVVEDVVLERATD
jgi:sirohydrochlorin ferrochelatase